MKKRLVLVLCPLLSAMTCGPRDDSSGTPDSDICRTPAAAADVTAVRLVSAATGATLADGGPLPITLGGQGTEMVGVHVEVDGADVPTCLAQTTRLASGGTTYTESVAPLNMHETEVAGTRRSGTLWLFPGAASGDVTLTTSVYGVTEEVSVTLTYDF